MKDRRPDTKEEKDPEVAKAQKRPYTTPVLSKYGDVVTLTRGTSLGATADDLSTSAV